MGQPHVTGLMQAGWAIIGMLAAIVLAPADLSAQTPAREVRVENQTERTLQICLVMGTRDDCEHVERGSSVIFTYPTRRGDSFEVLVREATSAFFGPDFCRSEHPFSTIRLVVREVGSCAVAPLIERGPDGALPVGLGEEGFARWSDGKWYPGRVAGFDPQGRVRVDFLDGDKGQFLPANVRRDGLRRGSFVYLRRSSGPTRVQIVERYLDTLIVSFGRGRRQEAVAMSEVVLNGPPEVTPDPVPGRRPHTLINVCNRTDERLFLSLGIAPEPERIVTEGWKKLGAGQCDVIDHTEFYMRSLPPEESPSIAPREAPLARLFYYAQNEATFSRFGQAVGFASSAGQRQIAGDNPNIPLCVMQLPNVSFNHVLDNGAAGFGEEQYCTDLNSRRVNFGEVTQSIRNVSNGTVITLNLE